jgi:D-aspartate ligase
VLESAGVDDLSGSIVVGGYANGLTVVRALRGLRRPVAVISTRPTDIAQYSRWTAEGVELLEFHQDPDSLIDLLLSRKKSWYRRAVFATNDHAATVLSRNRERLSDSYAVAMPDWETAEILLDKAKTGSLAARVGVETPRIFGRIPPSGEDACATAACGPSPSGIAFPVVVKPRQSHLFYERFRRKLVPANNPLELQEAVHLFREAGLEGLIQEWIPGPDSNYFNYSIFIDRAGEPRGGFTMRKLRKAPPFFGVCRVAETSDEIGLREPTLELLRGAGWRGMANAEYKLDPRDGRYKLMEVNGRCFLMQGLPLRAGINYPLMAFEDLSGQDVPLGDGNGWRGAWIHLHADLIYTLLSWKRERIPLRGYMRPYFRRNTYAVWDPRDPRPFLAQWWKAAALGVRTIRDEGLSGARSGIERIPQEGVGRI